MRVHAHLHDIHAYMHKQTMQRVQKSGEKMLMDRHYQLVFAMPTLPMSEFPPSTPPPRSCRCQKADNARKCPVSFKAHVLIGKDCRPWHFFWYLHFLQNSGLQFSVLIRTESKAQRHACTVVVWKRASYWHQRLWFILRLERHSNLSFWLRHAFSRWYCLGRCGASANTQGTCPALDSTDQIFVNRVADVWVKSGLLIKKSSLSHCGWDTPKAQHSDRLKICVCSEYVCHVLGLKPQCRGWKFDNKCSCFGFWLVSKIWKSDRESCRRFGTMARAWLLDISIHCYWWSVTVTATVKNVKKCF